MNSVNLYSKKNEKKIAFLKMVQNTKMINYYLSYQVVVLFSLMMKKYYFFWTVKIMSYPVVLSHFMHRFAHYPLLIIYSYI